MQSIDLVSGNALDMSRVRLLKPRELFYLRIESLKEVSSSLFADIAEAAKISSEVILSIPSDEFENEQLRNSFFELGIKGFSLRFTHKVEKWLKHQGSGQFNAGDRDIIDCYQRYLGFLPPSKDLVVEFQVGEDTRILAPTITGLYELGLKWAVVNVEGEPTLQRCLKMRDVFEYLKIRSCNRLNIYFPFWKEEFKEWDIKTQNTFSGLEYVHIDISNRCTHSCVFCGLYGPDAIEDMKKRAGGNIPESIKNFMKMEISSEKCFQIIESLPWSVRNVQFGGFGDPLMHKNAVNFIAAARGRGFSVEVLSNMEYLEDEDILKLHQLGGVYQNNLHFIANVSAGNSDLYIKTRPKQTRKNYEKVIHNLSLIGKLRKAHKGNGAFTTIMCVVNKLNCHALLELSQLAHQVGASQIWFKPMEIHGDSHVPFIPSKEEMKTMALSLKEAIKFADEKGIYVFQRDYCHEIISKNLGEEAHV